MDCTTQNTLLIMKDNTEQNLVSIECNRHGVKCSGMQISQKELTPEIELRNFIKKLSPVAVGHDLIRIGRDGDGGYLVPDDLEGISVCFSAGYGGRHRASFESMLYTQYNMRIFIVDRVSIKEKVFRTLLKPIIGIIRRMGSPNKCYFWDYIIENKFLGTKNDKRTIRFDDWIKKNNKRSTRRDFILQMDIEKAEWSVLQDVSSETLKRFRIIVIEFHRMHNIFRKSFFIHAKKIFDKILNDFVVAHIHPNNYPGNIYFYKNNGYRDIEICRTMEVTFIRKDRVLEDNRKLVFPHKLDRPNRKTSPDLVLPQIYQR